MRIPRFGEIRKSAQSNYQQMFPNIAGQMVQQTWLELPFHNNNIRLHEFVLMPDHVHGIIEISGLHSGHGVSEIVRQFKTFSARKINTIQKSQGEKIWQRGFHDHIIRNEIAYSNITKYIRNNPEKNNCP
jgi:REP element-mobilizing transposase RayT